MLTGNTLLHVAAVQFESEIWGKFVSRALRQFSKAMDLSENCKSQVMAMQVDLIEFVRVKIHARVDDHEVL